jgi:hypothetical protein
MRTAVLITIGVAIALLLLFGCPKEQPPAPPQKVTPPVSLLPELPAEMVVQQRTTTPAPGSEGAVQVTIDDITRGQVMVSLALKSGEPLLAPTSLHEGESASFELGGQTYHVTLEDLNNELIGDDSAIIVIDDEPPEKSNAQAPPAEETEEVEEEKKGDDAVGDTEAARIRQLIDHVRSLEGAVFIRNGEEHTPAEAADHLQRKWEAAGDQITTADQFIERLASRSSTSGEPYVIRFANGKETPSGEYLREQLEEMDRP